ncbi:U1 small nuclear ribonucleoprotein C-2 [Nymphaea thermarum]|nr:U1 small nuclear ribonucleoprotein C-2 [Nymphaea thermarum]
MTIARGREFVEFTLLIWPFGMNTKAGFIVCNPKIEGMHNCVYEGVGLQILQDLAACWVAFCVFGSFFQHATPSVRKQHNAGYKHKANVRTYYQQFEEQQTQSLIDQKVKQHLVGQTTYQQQVGVAFNQHLVSLPSALPRPRLPVLPPPGMPVGAPSQAHPNAPLMPGIHPPVFPRPAPGTPGYAMPPIVMPPGASSMSLHPNGLPMPPASNFPSSMESDHDRLSIEWNSYQLVADCCCFIYVESCPYCCATGQGLPRVSPEGLLHQLQFHHWKNKPVSQPEPWSARRFGFGSYLDPIKHQPLLHNTIHLQQAELYLSTTIFTSVCVERPDLNLHPSIITPFSWAQVAWWWLFRRRHQVPAASRPIRQPSEYVAIWRWCVGVRRLWRVLAAFVWMYEGLAFGDVSAITRAESKLYRI